MQNSTLFSKNVLALKTFQRYVHEYTRPFNHRGMRISAFLLARRWFEAHQGRNRGVPSHPETRKMDKRLGTATILLGRLILLIRGNGLNFLGRSRGRSLGLCIRSRGFLGVFQYLRRCVALFQDLGRVDDLLSVKEFTTLYDLKIKTGKNKLPKWNSYIRHDFLEFLFGLGKSCLSDRSPRAIANKWCRNRAVGVEYWVLILQHWDLAASQLRRFREGQSE